MMKAKKPFYLGHPRMLRDCIHGEGLWAKHTLEGAIEHAKKRCQETGEDQIVVKVVRVVRREQPPVRVEVVK